MISSKKINTITVVAVVFALLTSMLLVVIGNSTTVEGPVRSEPEYATKIFGKEIISIEIIADSEDWQNMLDNASDEEFIMADVIVNGTRFNHVGLRPKGNSSLKQVVNSNSDRYSFRLQFNEFIDGQTCFGLESFVVNNMIGDYTYMKEYVSYDLMHTIGVDAPYFGYAHIKVNGEDWGLYLAVELYNDSYEQRIYGDTASMLYNVKGVGQDANQPGQPQQSARLLGPGGANQRPADNGGQRPGMRHDLADSGEPPADRANPPDSRQQSQPPWGNDDVMPPVGGPGGGSGRGGSLEYIDDDIASYSAIFDNVVGKGNKTAYARVIKALKALSAGEELEKYFNVDQILRYLAAHTIVVNLDSYSSHMAQNYYILERDGQITILPWDYNLSWGGFQSSDATAIVNFPIDTPVNGVPMSSRPLLEKLFANPEYLDRYHGYLQALLDSYFADGKFTSKVQELDALIADYVKNDPTAFCTYDQYKKAVSTFIRLGNLRATSVQGQLDGTVPSDMAGQQANPDRLVAAEDVNLADLGSMRGGAAGNNPPGGMGARGVNPLSQLDTATRSKVLEIMRQAGGEVSEETQEALLALGLTAEQVQQLTTWEGILTVGRTNQQPGAAANRADMPLAAGGASNLFVIGLSVLLLLVAIVFVSRRQKNY